MLVTPQNLRAIFTGYNTSFTGTFNTTETQWGRVAMSVPSTTETETYGWLGSFPQIREWVGERQAQSVAAHGYSVTNKDYEGTLILPRPKIEDDRYGTYTPVASQLGEASKLHPDELVFSLLRDGTDVRCYDNQYFFDGDHPVRDAQGVVRSVSNYQDGGGPFWCLLDVSKVVRPVIYQKRKPYKFVSLFADTDPNVVFRNEYVYGVDGRGNAGLGFWQLAYGSRAPLTPANYAAARRALRTLKGDGGRPLYVRPGLLAYAPELDEAAREIIIKERLANGEDNINKGTAELLDVPFLG
jgi:phage major head subunit gpT-like protein